MSSSDFPYPPLKASPNIHTVPPIQHTHTTATCQAGWTYPPVLSASSSAQRSNGRSQDRHDSAGTGEKNPPAAPGKHPTGARMGCGSLRRAGRSVCPLLRQLSPRGVSARRCVGNHQQPGRPTGLQPPKHLQQRLLGEEDGGQHEPQVLQTAVHPHLQVSSNKSAVFHPKTKHFTPVYPPCYRH